MYMLLVNVYFGNLTTPSNVKKKNTQTLSAINPTFLRYVLQRNAHRHREEEISKHANDL